MSGPGEGFVRFLPRVVDWVEWAADCVSSDALELGEDGPSIDIGLCDEMARTRLRAADPHPVHGCEVTYEVFEPGTWPKAWRAATDLDGTS